jgi:hypothetical protein
VAVSNGDAFRLVAVEGDPNGPIWVVQYGVKRHITDWETFEVLGYKLDQVQRLALLEVAKLPNGPPLFLR